LGKNVRIIRRRTHGHGFVERALRLGAKNAYIVYRRSEAEMPARKEEIHHAMEEGVQFMMLTAPVNFIGNGDGKVKAMECIKMQLGEPDASGRRRPIPIEGSNFTLDVDLVVVAIGNSSNPLIPQTTPGLQANKWGNIIVNEETKETSRKGVFAGGDIVRGGATVILAAGDGRVAAQHMHKYLMEEVKK
jgi:glutamate synthase (NADPH/NADH) small chain